MLTDKEIIAATGKYGAAKEMVCNIGRLVIVAYEKKLREQKPVYQVWRSTDNCNEFYSWDDCDKSDYDLASDEDRRILFEHPAPIETSKHPIQPLSKDEHGVIRFKRNHIVDFLASGKLNELAAMDFPPEDYEQLAQLIGYSLSGFGMLSYVTDETYERAEAMLAARSGE